MQRGNWLYSTITRSWTLQHLEYRALVYSDGAAETWQVWQRTTQQPWPLVAQGTATTVLNAQNAAVKAVNTLTRPTNNEQRTTNP
jgi:hypothetical protein